jgi:hypothetical protein
LKDGQRGTKSRIEEEIEGRNEEVKLQIKGEAR